MEIRKRQLTSLFRHSEQCLSLAAAGDHSFPGPNNMLDSPRCPSVLPLVNIALASARLLWKVLLKRKFPLQDPINCDLNVRTL